MSKSTNIEFISIDFQKDFTDENGIWFNKGSSVPFIKEILIPYFRDKNIIINEIISDYRLPRLGRKGNGCNPDDFGYESEIPSDIKNNKTWIKCMHNPIWTRKNIGKKGTKPGVPYQDPKGFNKWLNKNIGKPSIDKKVILFGETMECCVLATAQELYFRGYDVKLIYEATDPMNERIEYKDFIALNSTLKIYAEVMKFQDLKDMIERD